MAESFKSSLPIYIQVMDMIKNEIISKKRLCGQKVESVRELAMRLGVNPNTVQRALMELEREGLVYSERTSGRFITEDPKRIEDLCQRVIDEKIRSFVTEMEALNIPKAELITRIQAMSKGEENGK